MDKSLARILKRLDIHNPKYVEIEVKRRVRSEQMKDISEWLLRQKKVRHQKANSFFDQFLDTPTQDVYKAGASLRLRYKGNGSRVYLQYKGPGFLSKGVLYRSEFSSKRLRHLVLEESHHDIVQFTRESVEHLLRDHLPFEMREAMERHLGKRTLRRIHSGPFITIYRKDKYSVALGDTMLEPSLDRMFAFHISRGGLHPLSMFCEYENEVKADDDELDSKLGAMKKLLAFDRRIAKRFKLPLETMDKYHRCATFFAPGRRRR